jgi:hypothetical protein
LRQVEKIATRVSNESAKELAIGLGRPTSAGASGSEGLRGARPAEGHSRLEGDWHVRRVSGLLLPAGLRKRIGLRSGSTRLGPVPVALFRVRGHVLDYRVIPVQDELSPLGDGTWAGRGLVLGREFCRFRLEPRGSQRRGPG